MRNQPAIDLKMRPLNPRQVSALQMVIDGYRKGEICERLGITHKTLFNWRRLPAWNEQVQAVLKIDSEDGQGQIKSLLPLAVQTLKALIVNGTDNIKLGASRTILEAHANLVQREEQAQVISDLERRLEEIAAVGVQSLAPAIAAEVIDAELEPVQSTGVTDQQTGTQEAV
jgi:hypothetical protein